MNLPGIELIFGPKTNWDGYDISKSNRRRGISIKCEWNWVEIDLRLNWKQFKISYQLDISNNKIILIQIF